MTELPSLEYAKPLQAVDRVVSLEEGSIVTEKAIRAEEDYFRGHYPDFPIYPGVFTVEAVNQAARIYADRFVGPVRLVQARTRFLAAVRPGDVLQCHLKIKSIEEGKKIRVDAKCKKGDVSASSVKLVFEVRSDHAS